MARGRYVPESSSKQAMRGMEHRRECIAHAETCQDLAAKAKHSLRRAELLELAVTWKLLAEQHESLSQSRKRLAELM